MSNTEKVSVNMNIGTLSQIDLLVDQGYYSDRSDFINQSVREALNLKQERIKAEEALKVAFHLIDKTVSDGIQHENTAARQKGELQRLVNSIK